MEGWWWSGGPRGDEPLIGSERDYSCPEILNTALGNLYHAKVGIASSSSLVEHKIRG
jgi:hypothetical protein